MKVGQRPSVRISAYAVKRLENHNVRRDISRPLESVAVLDVGRQPTQTTRRRLDNRRRLFVTAALYRLASAVDVSIGESALHFVLADGWEVSAPCAWFPRLRDATAAQHKNWHLIGKRVGAHWPDIDEDIAAQTSMSNH